MRILAVSIGFLLFFGSVAYADLYKVSVTPKAQDIYQIDGSSIYIKTRYCYEYAYSEDAILQIDSPSGYNVGELTFVGGGSKCDVEKVLR